MAEINASTPNWEEIDRAESYLVCCMFEEGVSLSSSVLRRLLESYSPSKNLREVVENYEGEWDDMVESSGMVLVQSLNHLPLTSDLLGELKMVFGSLTAIPIQVFLTGACFQVSENPLGDVQGYLKEYLDSWGYENGQYYLLSSEEFCMSNQSCSRFSIGVDKYLDIVELYVLTLLAASGKNTSFAISWVEKASLPIEKRQELLRRLHSIDSSIATNSSQTSITPHMPDEHKAKSDTLQGQKLNNVLKDFQANYLSNGDSTTKEEILKLSRQRVPCISWFPSINLKFGNFRLVVPSGKIILATLLTLLYYLTRKKQAALKRLVSRNVLSMKNVLRDLWHLAFSYQVNPLAAVQSLPGPTPR